MNIYLIQRAVIVKPLAADTEILSKAVRFDYMGSAEFEFGALPKSLRRIRDNFDNFKDHRITRFTEGEHALRLYSYMSNDNLVEYLSILGDHRCNPNSKIRLKESSDFSEDYVRRFEESQARIKDVREREYRLSQRTNFWWDIENDVMFTFKKEFSNRLPSYLKNSFLVLKD